MSESQKRGTPTTGPRDKFGFPRTSTWSASSGSEGRSYNEGRTGKNEGRTGNTEGRTGNTEGRTGNTEGRTGNTEGRTGNTEGRIGDKRLLFEPQNPQAGGSKKDGHSAVTYETRTNPSSSFTHTTPRMTTSQDYLTPQQKYIKSKISDIELL